MFVSWQEMHGLTHPVTRLVCATPAMTPSIQYQWRLDIKMFGVLVDSVRTRLGLALCLGWS